MSLRLTINTVPGGIRYSNGHRARHERQLVEAFFREHASGKNAIEAAAEAGRVSAVTNEPLFQGILLMARAFEAGHTVESSAEARQVLEKIQAAAIAAEPRPEPVITVISKKVIYSMYLNK